MNKMQSFLSAFFEELHNQQLFSQWYNDDLSFTLEHEVTNEVTNTSALEAALEALEALQAGLEHSVTNEAALEAVTEISSLLLAVDSSSSRVDVLNSLVEQVSSSNVLVYSLAFLFGSSLLIYMLYQIIQKRGGSPGSSSVEPDAPKAPIDSNLVKIDCSRFSRVETIRPYTRMRESMEFIEMSLSIVKPVFRKESTDLIRSPREFYLFLLPGYLSRFYSQLGISIGYTIMRAKMCLSPLTHFTQTGAGCRILTQKDTLNECLIVDLKSFYNGNYYRVLVAVWIGFGCLVWCAHEPGLSTVAPTGAAFAPINDEEYYKLLVSTIDFVPQSPEFRSAFFCETKDTAALLDRVFHNLFPFDKLEIPPNIDLNHNGVRIGISIAFLVTIGVLAPGLASGVSGLTV